MVSLLQSRSSYLFWLVFITHLQSMCFAIEPQSAPDSMLIAFLQHALQPFRLLLHKWTDAYNVASSLGAVLQACCRSARPCLPASTSPDPPAHSFSWRPGQSYTRPGPSSLGLGSRLIGSWFWRPGRRESPPHTHTHTHTELPS